MFGLSHVLPPTLAGSASVGTVPDINSHRTTFKGRARRRRTRLKAQVPSSQSRARSGPLQLGHSVLTDVRLRASQSQANTWALKRFLKTYFWGLMQQPQVAAFPQRGACRAKTVWPMLWDRLCALHDCSCPVCQIWQGARAFGETPVCCRPQGVQMRLHLHESLPDLMTASSSTVRRTNPDDYQLIWKTTLAILWRTRARKAGLRAPRHQGGAL